VKTLIVSPVFWPEGFRINDLATHLVSRGHEVEVLAGHPNYPEGRFFEGYSWGGPWHQTWQGAQILRFPQVPRGGGQAWRLALQYLSFVLIGSIRILFHGRWDWDVVLVFQTTPVTAALPALLAGRLSGGRKVIWVQDLWPDSLKAVGLRLPVPVGNLVTRLSGSIYRRFDRVLGQNEAFLPRLEAMGVAPSRLACVPQWADEGTPLPSAHVPPAWGTGFTALFAGNLGRAQGLETIIEAAFLTREVPGLQWVIMGDGALRVWLEEEIQRRGLSECVLLPGRRPAEEMSVHYERADVLLVSLRRDQVLADTLPGKVQACLAAGRPVLGAVEGVAAQVIRDAGAGLVVPPESPEALAAAMLRFMAMPGETRAFHGACGRAWYEAHYSQAVCISEIEKALKGERFREPGLQE
jgi:glycosyltransferase involved in cell wall biosynthesis